MPVLQRVVPLSWIKRYSGRGDIGDLAGGTGSTAVGNLSDVFSSSVDRITESIEDIVLYVAGKFKFVNRICVMKKKHVRT